MTDRAIGKIHNITRFLWAVAALLAPWLVPVGSAIIFGWSMYQAALSMHVAAPLAMLVGIATGAGLETTNIGAAHAAVTLSYDKQRRGRFWLACMLIVFYVILGIGAVSVLPIPVETRVIGGALFLLTPVAITAQALTLDLARTQREVDQKQAQAALSQLRREDDKRRADEEARREHERAMAEMATQVKLANARVREARAVADSGRTMTGRARTLPPAAGRWSDRSAFLSDPDRPDGLTSGQLADMAGISDRTARRWLGAARISTFADRADIAGTIGPNGNRQ